MNRGGKWGCPSWCRKVPQVLLVLRDKLRTGIQRTVCSTRCKVVHAGCRHFRKLGMMVAGVWIRWWMRCWGGWWWHGCLNRTCSVVKEKTFLLHLTFDVPQCIANEHRSMEAGVRKLSVPTQLAHRDVEHRKSSLAIACRVWSLTTPVSPTAITAL